MASAEPRTNEQSIRDVMRKWVEAVKGRDLDALMSFYTPDGMFFDGIAPLRVDFDTYRKNWEGFFKWFPGPVAFDTHDVRLAVGDTVAFASVLVRLAGTTAEGKQEGAWMRQTIGFESFDGAWRITHEHWSLPVDMESGKGLTDLTPE